MTKPRPVLLLEINEVPWRLLDRFMDDPEFPAIRRFFDGSKTFTTFTVDQGELSPWVTWPSFHRGMSNREHGIAFLGQDPKTYRGTPIWEEYRNRGYPIGVFGSLQSWPPVDPGQNGFYVPDTFAQDESCLPRQVEVFQRFNLAQTGKNGRIVQKGALGSSARSGELFSFLKAMPRLGISTKTVGLVAKQLLGERVDPARIARRPIFQAILAWDVFKSLYLAENPPVFSTFFTNHVAGILHRYWHHVFPEDFPELFEKKHRDTSKPHLATLRFALKVLDGILKDAMDIATSNPGIILVFATSMGQAAVHRNEHEGLELTIPRVERFIAAICAAICPALGNECRPLLAMVPQVAVEIPADAMRAEVKRILRESKTASGGELFRFEESGSHLNITLVNPRATDIRAGAFLLPGGKKMTWEKAEIRVIEIEAGTGYHIPEGVMAIYPQEADARDERRKLSARDAKGFLMGLSGL